MNNETLGMTAEYVLGTLSNIKVSIDEKRINNEIISEIRTPLNKVIKCLPCIKEHVGYKNGVSDFLTVNNKTISLKTNKSRSEKVCPQTIGQPTVKKWCEYFHPGEENLSEEDVKRKVQEHPLKYLREYYKYLFCCDYLLWLYYDYKSKIFDCKIFQDVTVFPFDDGKITFSSDYKEWNEGVTVRYNNISIGEFQYHKHRNCFKFRWFFKNILSFIDKKETNIITSPMLSIDYIGSKKGLYDILLKDVFDKYINKNITFADLFAGTGVVSTFVNRDFGCKVIANDIQYYSYVLNRANQTLYTEEEKSIIKKKICEYNNILDKYLIEDFFSDNYGTKTSMYFTEENAKRIDTLRILIEEDKNNVSDNVYYYLLGNLIHSVDKISNTSCVYGAFLKEFKSSSLTSLLLSGYSDTNVKSNSICLNKDIRDAVKEITADVVYLDPPYNTRQYSGNYHVLETLALFDNPEIKGKTGMRNCDSKKSVFCSKNKVLKEFENLIQNIKAKVIILSYNDEGLLNHSELMPILEKKGSVTVKKHQYKKFKAQKNVKRENVFEYLFVVEVE